MCPQMIKAPYEEKCNLAIRLHTMEPEIRLGSDGNVSHTPNIILRAKMTVMPKASNEKIIMQCCS